jgi:hypothetical protein
MIMKRIIAVIMFLIGVMCFSSCEEKEMKPIYAERLNDGTYSIEVKSSSSMFRVIDCKLTVDDNEMTAVITLSGTGYEKVYVGTSEQANSASENNFSYFTETSEGKYCYTIPVEALDKKIACAGFSTRKQKWYDRTLVFKSETLAEEALKSEPVPVIIILSVILAVVFAVIGIAVRCLKKRGK